MIGKQQLKYVHGIIIVGGGRPDLLSGRFTLSTTKKEQKKGESYRFALSKLGHAHGIKKVKLRLQFV